MSASPSNPFVLPGFGQSGDAATNPLLASLEMMRKAFAGLGGPAGMSAGLGLSPPMNPEELERKIAELKSVENWLKLNLSMLSSTIQGMEVQLATIATLKSFMAAGPAGSANPQAPNVQAASPSWFSGWPTAPTQPQSSPQTPAQPQTQPQAQASVVDAADDAAERPAKANGAAQATQGDSTQGDAAATSAAPAAQAWWDMLQQQFGQVAAATATSMALKPTPAAGKEPAKRASAATKTAAKTAAKTAPKTATKTARKTTTAASTKTSTKKTP